MYNCRLSLFLCQFLLVALVAAAEPARVGWMIYPYSVDSRLTEDAYQRLVNCAEADYAGFQMTLTEAGPEALARERIAALKAKGKRIVLQIWFGAGGPFTWERYNFPNLALDGTIRKEFMGRAIDPLIGSLGAKNLHAVHLMEETGMQFGWDLDMPGRPGRDNDGFDNGSNWDNPANVPWDRSLSGPDVLTIRRYNDLFKKETGLDMRWAPVWSPAEMERYKTWVQQTMEAGAHMALARHVHSKYPGLRVYSFNGGPALVPQSRVLDGQFIDPYCSTNEVYSSLHAFRLLMRPEAELVAMVWGNRDKPAAQRLPQQAACYLAGSNVLSTFGDNELKDQQWLDTVRASVRPFLGLPVFRSRSRALVLSGTTWGASLRNVSYWITGLAHYDAGEPWLVEQLKLKEYDLILAWGNETPGLTEWVRNGGVLVTVLPPYSPGVAAGLLAPPVKVGKKAFEYKPTAWMREQLKLGETYALELDLVQDNEVRQSDVVQKDGVICVYPLGKGRVVQLNGICDVHAPWEYEPCWEPYRQLLADLCRGALLLAQKPAVAADVVCDPAQDNDYLLATSTDGRTTVAVLLNDIRKRPSKTAFTIPGRDRVSGKDNAQLCEAQPVVVVQRE